MEYRTIRRCAMLTSYAELIKCMQAQADARFLYIGSIDPLSHHYFGGLKTAICRSSNLHARTSSTVDREPRTKQLPCRRSAICRKALDSSTHHHNHVHIHGNFPISGLVFWPPPLYSISANRSYVTMQNFTQQSSSSMCIICLSSFCCITTQ